MFRPASMAWVDLLVDRSAVTEALETLGSRDFIELQRPGAGDQSSPVFLEQDEDSIKRLVELERLLQPVAYYIPAPDPSRTLPNVQHRTTDEVLPKLEQQLRAWVDAVYPLIEQLHSVETNLEELELLESCLATIPEGELEIGRFAQNDTSRNYPGFLACGDVAGLRALDRLRDIALICVYQQPGGALPDRAVIAGTCAAERLPAVESHLHGGRWRFVKVPLELLGSVSNAPKLCRDLLRTRRQHLSETVATLNALNQRFDIASLHDVLRRHLWANRILSDARLGQRFVWLCGWVPNCRVDDLAASLDTAGIHFLMNVEAPHGHGPPPVELQNPRWVRRFEIFVRGFGVPDTNEIDPSSILAITTPLMFGYMFGDVGHGAVIFCAGLWFGRRLPVLMLLVPAGLASMLFGLLFGSVFCNEHLIPALWIVPMEEPLMILAIPVVFGLLLILLSLALDAIQETWKGQAVDWWIFRFPVVVSFLGLMVGVIDQRALWVGAAGALWVIVAQTARAASTSGLSSALTAPLKSCVELAETLLQMFINILSFTRLGAFALAHAGLGMAVIILAGMPDATLYQWSVFVAGNVLVIALEGLVVSVQTTRLVMFEFFRRFLVGRGRPFRPLRSPGTDGTSIVPGAA